MFNNFFPPKIVPLWENVEKYCRGRAGHRRQYNTVHSYHMLDT